MIMRRSFGALAAALALALSLTASAQPSKLPNEFCPILRDKKALPEHWSDYKGRRVYFCCDDCKQTFDLNPEAVGLGPPPIQVEAAGGHVHGPGYAEFAALLGGGAVGTPARDPANVRPFVIAGLAVLLVGLVIARVRGVPARAVPKQAVGLIVMLGLWTL